MSEATRRTDANEPGAVPLARRVALLAAVPAFEALSAAALDSLAARLEEAHHAAGATIVREGEAGDRLFLLASGRAEVSVAAVRGAVALATLQEGELFGEIALLSMERVRTATVTSLCPTIVLGLHTAAFEALLAQHPAVRERFAQTAETREAARFLKLASPFTKLSADRLHTLAARLERLSAPTGATIVRQGEPGDTCYLLRSGRVEVVRRQDGPDGSEGSEGPTESRLSVLGPGMLFGEAALLADVPRNASVRAIEPCQLLALHRRDLLAAMGASPEVRSHVLSLARARDCPRQADGIVVRQRATPEGETLTILKNPARGTYFRLSPQGYFLWRRLDGEHALRDLALDYFVQFQAFAPDAILELLAGLARAGFVETRALAADVSDADQAAMPAWQRATMGARHLLEWRITLRDVDRRLDWLYRQGVRRLFTPLAQVLLAVLALCGLLAFVTLTGRVTGTLAHAGLAGPLLALALAMYAASVFVHELGHAFTVKAFGREVLGAGVGWYWFAPMAYVDTSDMWLAGRWPRIAVSLAGPYANVLLAASAALVALSQSNAALVAVLWQFAFISYVGVLLNLNPLQERDGYFVLIDLLERPNLRVRCLRWLGRDLLSALRQPTILRAHLLELLYGLGTLVYIAVMIGVTIVIYRLTVERWLAHVIPHVVASGLAWLLALAVAVLCTLGVIGELRGSHGSHGQARR
jgi:putative peptide zinc metalloprotease protein